MENIEKQINKLIKEIEECADKFEILKMKYGVTYVRENECENSDLKLKLTSTVEAPPAYELDKEMAYMNYQESKEEDDDKRKNLAMALGELELKYSEEEKNKIQRFEDDFLLNDKEDYIHSYTVKTTELLFNTFEALKEQAKFLITLLEKTKQLKFKERVDAIEIKRIQAKNTITVKEFTIIFNRSDEWQRIQRRDKKLPFIQKEKNDKIEYDVEEVKKWFRGELN